MTGNKDGMDYSYAFHRGEGRPSEASMRTHAPASSLVLIFKINVNSNHSRLCKVFPYIKNREIAYT